MFGFRAWSATDLDDIDADTLDSMIAGAKRYEAEMRKEARRS